MTLTRPVVAVALGVVGLVAGGTTVTRTPARADGPHVSVLVLDPRGSSVRTPFATTRGATYRIVVTGIYSYNGAAGLADCGHWDPEDAQPWGPLNQPMLDRLASRCTTMPFTPSHTYCWDEPGTGAPYVFAIRGAVSSDDVGALVVTVAREDPAVAALPCVPPVVS